MFEPSLGGPTWSSCHCHGQLSSSYMLELPSSVKVAIYTYAQGCKHSDKNHQQWTILLHDSYRLRTHFHKCCNTLKCQLQALLNWVIPLSHGSAKVGWTRFNRSQCVYMVQWKRVEPKLYTDLKNARTRKLAELWSWLTKSARSLKTRWRRMMKPQGWSYKSYWRRKLRDSMHRWHPYFGEEMIWDGQPKEQNTANWLGKRIRRLRWAKEKQDNTFENVISVNIYS